MKFMVLKSKIMSAISPLFRNHSKTHTTDV